MFQDLSNSETPKDDEMKVSYFDFIIMMIIFHTLSISIVLIFCHGMFLVYCIDVYGLKK